MTDTPKYQNDQWCLGNTLGMAQAGDRVAVMALETPAPFTLGVVGKWGSGKTSLMRRAFATLKGQPISQGLPLSEDRQEDDRQAWHQVAYDYVPQPGAERDLPLDLSEEQVAALEQTLCVWYSPWLHQNTENPLIPLLMEIQKQYTWRFKAKQTWGKINRQGGLAGLALLEKAVDAAIGLTLGKPVKAVQGTSDAVRKAWHEGAQTNVTISDGQRFHLLFEDAVETALKGLPSRSQTDLQPGARLIVFIDDLDRCEESQAIKLLESIKLYLSTQRCVFVLGMDYSALLGALKRVWSARSDDENREYLEKLLQATVSVPLPLESCVISMLENQLVAHKMHPEGESDHCKTQAQQIQALLEPNPRKLKNFVNSLCADWAVMQCAALREQGQIERFIMFHYLKQYHPAVWRILERQPRALVPLYRVLNNLPESATPDQGHLLPVSAQRIVAEFFSREFSHVLAHTNGEPDSELLHGKQSLDKAVDDFFDRLDRKCSDEYFLRWFRDNIKANDAVASHFLHITETSTEAST